MISEKVYAGSVDDFSALIREYDFLSGSLVLLEMLPQHIIMDKSERQNLLYFAKYSPEMDNITEYTSGCIFRKDFELRWEKSDGKVQVVYFGEERSVPKLEIIPCLKLQEFIPRERQYYLFGRRLTSGRIQQIGDPAQEGDFAEVRIPRLLRYPVEEHVQCVKLVVLEYLHQQTGELMMFRFQGLLEVKE